MNKQINAFGQELSERSVAYEPIIIIDKRVYIGCCPIYAIFVIICTVCIARYCGLGTNDNRELRCLSCIYKYYAILYIPYTSPLKNERCYIKYLPTISITYIFGTSIYHAALQIYVVMQ